MGTPYIGEIRMFAGNFAPQGYAFCAGQLVDISQNEALFNLIGTTYGGDGQTTFALPDLRGRTPLHQSAGYVIGQKAGTETETLGLGQIPAHSHAPQSSSVAGTQADPTNARWAAEPNGVKVYSTAASPAAALLGSTVGSAGGNQPHENMPPYLAINFIIALFGVFPSPN